MLRSKYSDPNLELILVSIARQYAPRLVPVAWHKPGDLKMPPHILARWLANYHVLLVRGDRGSQSSDVVPAVVRECSDLYQRLYLLLTSSAFPTLSLQITRFYYSYSKTELLIVLTGEARGVIETLAGCVAPYVAERQKTKLVTSAELVALMERVLQKLEIDLQRQESHRLIEEGTQIVKMMLGMDLRQLPLTQFDEPFFSPLPQHRPKPPKLPEEDQTGAKPFVDQGRTTSDEDGLPDFLKTMFERNGTARPQEPERDTGTLPRLNDHQEPPETGKHPPADDAQAGRPPARRGGPNGSNGPQAPLPYWPPDGEDEH